MEKNGVMRKYELVLIIDAILSPDDKAAIVKQTCDLVTKYGGKVINSQVWFERQKLSFSIKKRWEGTYYLINFESNGEGLSALNNDLRVSEQVLRHAVTKFEGKPLPAAA